MKTFSPREKSFVLRKMKKVGNFLKKFHAFINSITVDSRTRTMKSIYLK